MRYHCKCRLRSDNLMSFLQFPSFQVSPGWRRVTADGNSVPGLRRGYSAAVLPADCGGPFRSASQQGIIVRSALLNTAVTAAAIMHCIAIVRPAPAGDTQPQFSLTDNQPTRLYLGCNECQWRVSTVCRYPPRPLLCSLPGRHHNKTRSLSRRRASAGGAA